MSSTTEQPTTSAVPGTTSGAGFQIAGNSAERYERAVAEFMLEWSDDLVDLAALGTAERVVDLACGTGFLTRIAAARVGTTGTVVGIDINPHMVAEARRVTGLEIIEAPADATGLASESYDVVLCQQGLQYVGDPAAVLKEAHRVLRPGGRIAVSVWSDFEHNPFRIGQLDAMKPHLTDSAVDAYRASSIASLGGRIGLAESLRRATFADIDVEERRRVVRLPPMHTYFPVLVTATPWKDAFENLTDNERHAVVDRLETYVDHSADGGSLVAMSVTVATATRPDRAGR